MHGFGGWHLAMRTACREAVAFADAPHELVGALVFSASGMARISHPSAMAVAKCPVPRVLRVGEPEAQAVGAFRQTRGAGSRSCEDRCGADDRYCAPPCDTHRVVGEQLLGMRPVQSRCGPRGSLSQARLLQLAASLKA